MALQQRLVALWKAWSPQALLRGLDRRRLQQEIDTHRLFLLTRAHAVAVGSYHRLGPGGSVRAAAGIEKEAGLLAFEEQASCVQANVHAQILQLLRAMQYILEPAAADCVAEAGQSPRHPRGSSGKGRRSGLTFATSGMAHAPYPQQPPSTSFDVRPLSFAEVAADLLLREGFCTALGPSLVPHPDAGEGLFLKGNVQPGAVVGIYPGVLYGPAQYRHIPHYPKVDHHNPYLMSRFDGTVIDAKPWGRGESLRGWWSGLDAADCAWYDNHQVVQRPRQAAQNTSHNTSRPVRLHEQSSAVKAKTAVLLERRNPLGLCHFANHPGPGSLPNVMVCPYDFPEHSREAEGLRPYLPNVLYGGGEARAAAFKREGGFWVDRRSGALSTERNDRNPSPEGGGAAVTIPTLLLVATRELCDEELLLNYRLSTPLGRPDWYTPVDVEEDRRRWA